MTPAALRRALTARRADWPDDDHDLLAAVEAQAEAHPGDAGWTALLLTTQLLHSAPDHLPDGLQRDALLRFDALSATWSAHDGDGARWLVRVPRDELAPVHRRLLERERRALAPLVQGLHSLDGCLVAPLLGAAVVGPQPPPVALRLVGTTLVALARWHAAGFGPLAPCADELRHEGGVARVVSLTPGPIALRPWIHHLAVTLRPTDELLQPLLRGLVELPPGDLSDAADRVVRALRGDLASRALALRRRGHQRGLADRRARLLVALHRLEAAAPAPTLNAPVPVGYDLEARRTHAWRAPDGLWWGAEAEPQRLWSEAGFDAPAARRLLRALATAPSPSDEADTLGRWVAAGLRVRTLRLLLERAP